MNKAVIGINCSGMLSSACLLVDGRIEAAICEERLTRVKQDRAFPHNAIKYCCDVAGIDIGDVGHVFFGWNPIHYMHKPHNSYWSAMSERSELAYMVQDELAHVQPEPVEEIRQQLKTLNNELQIHYLDHHRAHITNSFLSSGFENAAMLVADGYGEKTSGFAGEIDRLSINELQHVKYPHSLGSIYATITGFLGFRYNSDEWKVMALSALGDKDRYYDKVKELIKVDGLTYEVDLSYFEYYLFFTEKPYTEKFVAVFGEPPQDGLTQEHFDLVAAFQRVVEETIIELLCNLFEKTKNPNLVVSGGLFMNSVMNGKILDNTPFSKMYVGGSPDDSGISIGSALYGYHYVLKRQLSVDELRHNYLGRSYTDQEIIAELETRKIGYERLSHPERTAAELIHQGNIVAWMQGPAEFGHRALGNRSILADPTRSDIKDIINRAIKYREHFRPFAPSVLQERQYEFFEITKKQESLFMEKVYCFKNEYRDKLPGVVHYDGTGRIHTVDKAVNPKYYKLISEFEKLSGFPIVLNTSFNINGMPLVESPGDAVDCFFKCGLDVVIIHDICIRKA
jgi:carbamoyltransferase